MYVTELYFRFYITLIRTKCLSLNINIYIYNINFYISNILYIFHKIYKYTLILILLIYD